MNNAIHFVLDLETISTAPNAAIAAIGCVRVQQGEIIDEFYERVDLESSRAMGGEIDTPTLQWWLKQSREARQEVSGELASLPITTALGKLTEFMHRGGLSDDQPLVWGNGSSFDNVILGTAYQRAGIPMPWKFWNDRDLRTLLALHPHVKQAITFEGTKHHALHDARHEAKQLICALRGNGQAELGPAGTAEFIESPVMRDELGHWTHPAWPSWNDESGIPKSWFTDNGLELYIVEFESDASPEMQAAYFEQGNPSCSAWQPSQPTGNGWFVFSIHDTEDGPVCVWVRKQQDLEGAVA